MFPGHLLQRLLRQALAENALQNVLFARFVVPDADDDSGGDVAGDGEGEDGGGQGFGAHAVVDGPGTCSQGDLQQTVAVEEHDRGDHELEGEGMVGGGFVGLVEGVAFVELGLVVLKSLLLAWRQDGVLGHFFLVHDVVDVRRASPAVRKVVVIDKVRELFLLP